MSPATQPASPTSELVHGQVVIVFARWLLVLASLMVAVWDPGPLAELRLQIAVVLGVAIANFYLHAQLLRRRPALGSVARAASVGDLLVIALLVASQGGFRSDLYVFFFPALLAISVAFPTRQTATLAGLAIGLYGLVGSVRLRGETDVLLLRLLALAAVAVIGNAYWRLHRQHIRPTDNPRREAAGDLFFGQVVLLWARWFVIGGAALLVLARAGTTTDLALGIVPILVLLLLNFFLHGRYLVERPANAALTLAASGVDLAMVGVLFLTWPDAQGLSNPYAVVLYPLVFAFALVFGPRLAAGYTLGGVLLYGGLCLVTGAGLSGSADLKVLVLRLITLAATGGLGTAYWRLVRRARRGAPHQTSLADSLGAAGPAFAPAAD